MAAENNNENKGQDSSSANNNSHQQQHQQPAATRTGVRSGSVKNITSGFNAASVGNSAVGGSNGSFVSRNSRSASGSSVSKNFEGENVDTKSSLVIVSNDFAKKGKQSSTQLEAKIDVGSNEALNENSQGAGGGKKRPPTPPRKPRINPRDFPGLQFMGKDGFGVADNLSSATPSPSKSSPENTLENLHSQHVHSPSSPQSSSTSNQKSNSSSHSPGPLINPESSSKIISDLKQPTVSRLATVSHDFHQQQQQQSGHKRDRDYEEPAYATRLVTEIANEMVHSSGTVLITESVNDSTSTSHRYPSQHSLDASVELDFNDVHGAVEDDRRKENEIEDDEDENCTTTETETTATEVDPTTGYRTNNNTGSNHQIPSSSSRERLDKSDSINDDLSLGVSYCFQPLILLFVSTDTISLIPFLY